MRALGTLRSIRTSRAFAGNGQLFRKALGVSPRASIAGIAGLVAVIGVGRVPPAQEPLEHVDLGSRDLGDGRLRPGA